MASGNDLTDSIVSNGDLPNTAQNTENPSRNLKDSKDKLLVKLDHCLTILSITSKIKDKILVKLDYYHTVVSSDSYLLN